MRKKLLFLILAVALLLTAIPALAGAEGCVEHSYVLESSPSCESAGFETCSVCGKRNSVPAAGHNFVTGSAPTCVEAGYEYCTACGKRNSLSTISHNFVTDSAPSCEAAGFESCTTCGKRNSLSATGHNFVVGSAATCDNAGFETCTACGKRSNLPATGHNYVTAVAPTCDKAGYDTCSACGKRSNLPALGHSFSLAQEATCTAVGYNVCATCNKRESIPAKGHTEVVDAAVAATCTTAGKTEGKHCSVCGTVIVAQTTIAAKGHTEVVDAAVAATCTTAGKTEGKHCSVCGTVIVAQTTIAAKGHTEVVDAAVAATCTTTGKTEGKHCSVCGIVIKAQDVIPAKGHMHTAVVTAPTCTTEGFTTYTCVCGDTYVSDKKPAAGHTEVIDASVPADCTTAGKTEGKHCSVCNTVLIAQKDIPALGHTEVTDPAVSATCVSNGLTEGKHCSVCDAVIVEQKVVGASGHNYVKRVFAPTTTSNGYTVYECLVCGDRYVTNYKAMLRPASTQAPVEAPKSAYGSIVTSVDGTVEEYTTEDVVVEDVNGKTLVIIAEPEVDGTYATRNLHLSAELLAELKNDDITEIQFVVGDATVSLPMSCFDGENINLVKEAENCGDFVITLSINETENEKAVSSEFGVQIKLDTEVDLDVTSLMTGVKVLISNETATACANANGENYAASQDEGVWAIDVVDVATYTMIAE